MGLDMKNSPALIVDFVEAARLNGITNLWAYLPKSHYLIKTNKAAQIRKVSDCVACGFDELGNRVRLTLDGRVLQDCP
jgi:hypothetical protein